MKSIGFMPVSRLFFLLTSRLMHLLYLDESGTPEDPADKHFILAGLSAFEKNTHFLSTEADRIQAKHFPGSPPVDFHAQHIRGLSHPLLRFSGGSGDILCDVLH